MNIEEFIYIADIHKQDGFLRLSLDDNFIDYIEELEKICSKNKTHPLNEAFEDYIFRMKKSILKNM